jgi:hypothetical protein
MAYWMHLEGFQVVSSNFWALVCTGLTGRGHRSDQWECWFCSHVAHRSDRWCWPVWPVRAELLQLPCFKLCFACFRPGELHWFRGSLHVCRGSSLWFFEISFGGLRSLLEHNFVSDVSSRCSCLRGPRLVFFKWSCSLPLFGFRSLVGVFLFVSFLFLFSRVTLCGCCQCTHQGGDWGPCVVQGPVDGRFGLTGTVHQSDRCHQSDRRRPSVWPVQQRQQAVQVSDVHVGVFWLRRLFVGS